MANIPLSGMTFAIPEFPAFSGTYPAPYTSSGTEPTTVSFTSSGNTNPIMDGAYSSTGSTFAVGAADTYSSAYCFQRQTSLPPTNFWRTRTGLPPSTYAYDPTTGVYNPNIGQGSKTTVVDGQTISGEYVTITAPYAFVLSGYTIISSAADDWVIAGSNDGGTTFSLVDTITGINLDSDSTYDQLYVTNTTAYSTYRIIITKVPVTNYTGGASISLLNLYKPDYPCFLEGTGILCLVDGKDVYVPIEQMKQGMLVKTEQDGYKKLELIGHTSMMNPGTDERIENRLYKCSPSNYADLTEDLFITGCHSVLVNSLTAEEREGTVASLGKIFITGKKYRLMACLDKRAEPWNSYGKYNIWHIALENENIYSNYGIFANGLLVETCNIHYLRDRTQMSLV
jgi:hypothetical protein